MTNRRKNQGHITPVKQKAAGVVGSKLKGLERRNKSGRRAATRRKSDPSGQQGGQFTAELQSVCLADEAGTLVANFYKELFSLFPCVASVLSHSGADEQSRKILVAMEQLVDCLRRQDQRVKTIVELAGGSRDEAAKTEHNGVLAETLLELVAEFSSDSWNNALEQIRSTRDT